MLTRSRSESTKPLYRRAAGSSREAASTNGTVACPPMTSEGGSSDELNAWWRIGAVVVGALAHALFRPLVLNAEHIPGGPAILAANHVSVLDGPLLAWPPAARRRRAVRFLVAAENFRLPLIGSILRAFRQIPIRRGERD